jgi:uroporphyrinogen-III synthase
LREGPLNAAEKPLAGKCIVVTRAPDQARELIEALELVGAEVLLLPAVCFAAADDWTVLDEALRKIAEFDWLLFTSRNAIRFFCQRCRELGIRCEELALPRLKVGAVGPTTAQASEHEGIRVEYTAKDQSGEGLVTELRDELQGKRVLLPRSDRADDRLPKALRDAGAIVTEAVAYRTTPPADFDSDVLAKVRRAEVDAIIFASASAFYNLRNALNETELSLLSSRVQFTAIGPTTARAMRESGATLAIETKESTTAGLATALVNHYQGNLQL